MANAIQKNKTASVGKYSYQYVDLAQIHEYLESINSKYIQKIERIDGDDYIFTKRCFNDEWENEWLQGCKVVDATLFGVKNPAQEQGSAITYARRYSVLLAYGLCTEDTDASELSRPIEMTEEDAKNYVITFGKHKGQKIKDLLEDKGYINWLVNNAKDPNVLKAIEVLTGEKPRTDEEWDEKIALTTKFMDLIVEKNLDTDAICKYYGVEELKDLKEEQIKEIVEKRG